MSYDIIIGRDENQIKELGNKGLIFLGKQYVKMGQFSSLSNKVMLDVNTSHVILVCGKRGCLKGDTKVFTDKGYKNIKDFDEKNDKIYSFNKGKNEFEWENAKLLKYPINNERLYKINFYDGRVIILTKEHPLLMNYGKYLFWRETSKLKVDDKIVMPTELPEVRKDKESLSIARTLGFVLSDGSISKRIGRWKDGRGYWYNGTKSRLRINNDCEEVLKSAKDDLEKEFGLYVKRYERNDCNCEIVQSLHAPVIDKFNSLGVPLGFKAGTIRIPDVVWESSNEFKANFIAGLFSCDGYIAKNGCIDYSSKSRKFLEDLQLLLSHFNIESVIRVKNVRLNNKIYKNYRLFITDNFSFNNFKKIGFFNPFKQERLNQNKENYRKSYRKRKTFYFSENLVCKKIKNIEEIEGVNEVYDLTVPKNHSFIANGMISHNSGKSYALSVIAEEMSHLPEEVNKNIAVLIFDTMGIFWSMKYPNTKQEDELKWWGMKPQGLNVKVYTPLGKFKEYKNKGIPTDFSFSIKPNELSANDWVNVFDLKVTEPIGVLIEKVVSDLEGDYDLDDIIKRIQKEKKSNQENKNAAENRFQAAKSWGIFDKRASEIKDIVKGGQVSILDTSCYEDFNVKALVTGILSKKLLLERMDERKKEEMSRIQSGEHFLVKEQQDFPMVWILIDEAHEMLVKKGKTPATDALVQILREGRQPGISLVLATQQPGEIHKDVLTQSDVVISFRLTAKVDIEALNSIMQTYLTSDILTHINDLPDIKGSGIILDDTSERIYPFKTRPKSSWHGGDAPSAVKIKKKILDIGL